MTARDLPNGTGTPCQFHKTSLTGWDNAYHRHETPAEREQRGRHLTGSCCDHPRPTRDGHPSTEENQP